MGIWEIVPLPPTLGDDVLLLFILFFFPFFFFLIRKADGKLYTSKWKPVHFCVVLLLIKNQVT